MAYDKIIAVHHRLDHCINYALNERKTVNGKSRLVAGINCDPETALEDMKATKRRWDKGGGVVGYHLIHSYKPGETTPEEAQAAGVEFAQRLLGERYEAVVCTHIDHEHLHCHIVFNSVSFMDGKKYRNDFKAYFGDIRETSNEVSRERSLSVIDHPENKGRHYAEWNAEKQGKPTGKTLVRQDVDAAIESAFTYKSFWTALEKMGYGLEHAHGRKHPAVRPPGSDRYFRLDGLGDGYTEEAIKQRIANHREAPRKETVEYQPLRIPRRYIVKRRYQRPGKLNRCHLIGYQLTGENANVDNLITGTRYFNVEGMLPLENEVAEYVQSTGHHVLYRVTPIYEGDNLLANGLLMEAYSVEDDGAGVCFCNYVYNAQPYIEIDYATGESSVSDNAPKPTSEPTPESTPKPTPEPEQEPEQETSGTDYIANTNTGKFHYPYCSSVDRMKESNKLYFTGSRESLIEQGYVPCKRCDP